MAGMIMPQDVARSVFKSVNIFGGLQTSHICWMRQGHKSQMWHLAALSEEVTIGSPCETVLSSCLSELCILSEQYCPSAIYIYMVLRGKNILDVTTIPQQKLVP